MPVLVTFRTGIAEAKCILATAVCVSVCLLQHSHTTARTWMSLVTWGNGMGCPLVVHYWADLQLVHGFRCYDNIHVHKLTALYTANAYSAECETSASARIRSMAAFKFVVQTKMVVDS